MADKTIAINLLARDKASREFEKVGNAANKAAKHGAAFGALMGGAVTAGVAALSGVIKTGFGELQDYQAGFAQASQVIKSTGGSAGVSAKHVEDLASSIQGYSGQTDDAIVSGQNLLLTFTNIKNGAGKGNDVFDQTTKIMADMSQAMGQDTKTSAIQLGKALNDPIKGVSALHKVGVTFSDAQKTTIKRLQETGDTAGAQKVILAELTKEFGGSAKAFGDSGPGQIQKAKRSFEDVTQSIAQGLLPVVTTVLGFVNDKLIPVFGKIGDVAGQVFGILFKGDFKGGVLSEDSKTTDVIFRIRDALVKLGGFIQTSVIPAAQRLGDMFSTKVMPVLAKLGDVIATKVVPAWTRLGGFLAANVFPILSRVAGIIVGQVVPTLVKLATFIETKVVPVILKIVEKVLANLMPAFRAIVDFVQTHLVPGLQKLIEKIEPLIQAILKIVGPILQVASKILGFLIPIILKLAGPIFNALITVLGVVITAVTKTLNAIVPAFEGIGKAASLMWDKVLRPTFKFLVDAWLSVVGVLVHGAASAFGWVPGIGPKLKNAAKEFDKFKDQVNASLDGVHKNVHVQVTADYRAYGANAQGVATNAALHGRATGGQVLAGHSYVVGEREPELFIPRETGHIYNSSQIAPAGGGGEMVVNIDARGAQAGVAQEIVTALRRYKRELGGGNLGLA